MNTIINVNGKDDEVLDKETLQCWADAFEQSMNDNPNMKLFCLYCGNTFDPYSHNANHDFVFMSFCNEICFKNYHSWKGKIRKVMEHIIWLVRKPYYWAESKYLESIAPPCPDCGEKLFNTCGMLFHCDNDDCMWMGMLEKKKRGEKNVRV